MEAVTSILFRLMVLEIGGDDDEGGECLKTVDSGCGDGEGHIG